MKHLILYLFVLFFLFSCTKSTTKTTIPQNNTNNPPVADSLQLQGLKFVDSTWQAANGTITKFSYDQNKQLASILIHSSQNMGPKPVEDTFLMVFNLTGTTAPPASYDYTWYIPTNSTDAIEHHVLIYDSQNRIILDSMAYGTTTLSAYVYLENTRYIYTADTVIMQHYTNNIGATNYSGPAVISMDTISLINGNVVRNANWLLGTNGPVINQITNYFYTTYRNPLFQTNLSSSLGPFLLYNGIGDFISTNFMNPYGSPNNAYSYNYSTDSTGDLTGIDQFNIGAGIAYTQLKFMYQ